MDTTVLVALIGAVGMILAAVIPILLRRRISSPTPAKVSASAQPDAKLEGVCEQALRHHAHVQRLLGNNNWKYAAEAAIAYFCRGAPCAVESWRQSSAWQQIGLAHAELSTKLTMD